MSEHNELGWAYKVLFVDLGMCGCGMFDQRLALLKETLELMPLYELDDQSHYLRTPLGEWFLTTIDNARLIEHGSSIGGSWITDKGARFLKTLEDLDKLEEYVDNNGFCECAVCISERKDNR